MTCEKAESYLSAYLDDMLDPPLREDVAAHVESCAHCAEVLADYRRFDALLASMVHVTPADSLRDRIFGSSEFARILREQSGSRGGRTSVPLLERPVSGGDASGDSSEAPIPIRTGHRGSSPPWWRVALQSAAVIALLLGSALLIKQGLFHSGTTTGRGPQTIGGHGAIVPLSAGQRAVYVRSGELWSAPENGPGLAQRLTPAGMLVTGWAVSPDGRTIAYIIAADGSVHVIRSDDQNDHVVGTASSGSLASGFWDTAAGKSVAAGISWSPDGKHIAYVGADSSGQTALHIMSANGSDNRAMGNTAPYTGTIVWSSDSTHLAFVQSSATGAQTISVYDAMAHEAFQLTAADPSSVSATVAHLAWLSSTPYPSLTWAVANGGTVTGIFTEPAASSATPRRLTSVGAHYTAADFTSTHDSNLWIVSSATSLATIPAEISSEVGVTAYADGTVSQVVWSPSGDIAAYLTTGGRLGLWTPGAAPLTIATGITDAPVWSPDGSRLAVQVSDGVVSVRIAGGGAAALTRLANASGHVELSWSPDGQVLAIGGSSGLMLVSNGHVKSADRTGPTSGMIAWTIAG